MFEFLKRLPHRPAVAVFTSPVKPEILDKIVEKLELRDPLVVKTKGKNYNENKNVVKNNSTVTCLYIENGLEETYTIVPSYVHQKPVRMGGPYYGNSVSTTYLSDSDPDKGIISERSPLAKHLLGHCVGYVFTYKSLGGNESRIRITSIKP